MVHNIAEDGKMISHMELDIFEENNQALIFPQEESLEKLRGHIWSQCAHRFGGGNTSQVEIRQTSACYAKYCVNSR